MVFRAFILVSVSASAVAHKQKKAHPVRGGLNISQNLRRRRWF